MSDDVRGARLAEEAHDRLGALAVLFADQLDRDVLPEPEVLGAVDLPHPARAEQRVEPVLAREDLSLPRAPRPCVIRVQRISLRAHAASEQSAPRRFGQALTPGAPRARPPRAAGFDGRASIAASLRPPAEQVAMIGEPHRLRPHPERREDDRLLRVVEEERVVDDAAARLDVLGGVPGERAHVGDTSA